MEIIDDIQVEIMLLLSPKSLLKFMCVSKKWASTICEKGFRDLYLHRSMKRPRVMFTISPTTLSSPEYTLFHSIYQEEEPLLSSGQKEMSIVLKSDYHIFQLIGGLICLQNRNKLMLCNPCIKKFLILPEIRASDEADITCYFGYDEATDVFKVLCMSVLSSSPREAKEHQVLTVGSGRGSCKELWRPIKCKHRHDPITNGICKNGVLYYGTCFGSEKKPMVICFNIKSEEFTVIDVPGKVEIKYGCYLVNYNEDIAVVENFEYVNGVIEMWVRNETTGEWWSNRVMVQRWRETVEDLEFSFKGIIGTGEFIFALDSVFEGSLVVLYYDTITQNLRRFHIQKGLRDSLFSIRTFLNHVDSLSLIQETKNK